MKNYCLLFILCSALVACCVAWRVCDQGDSKRELRTLQNLLEWELMQQSFYTQAARTFGGNITGIPENEIETFGQFKDQTDAYVQNLTALIAGKGGDPIQPCGSYLFGFGDNSTEFLNQTIQLENWGNALYLGAISNISNPALQTFIASIASIKARHAAWLSAILNRTPFVRTVDTPLSVSSVKRRVNEVGIAMDDCPIQNNQCFGFNSSDTEVCGGTERGQCVAKNVCICKAGFKGSDCSERCRGSGSGDRCFDCHDSCCNDVRRGPVCYTESNHSCVASQEEENTFVLCGRGEGVCNLWCFDANLYQCEDGVLVLKQTITARPISS